MKLKLNDPKQIGSQYHRNELFQQNRDINSWLYNLGMSRHKIESHPCVADIRLLLDLSKYKNKFSNKDYEIFDKIWKNVYINEYPLTNHYKYKLLGIIDGIEYRQAYLNNGKTKNKEERRRNRNILRKMYREARRNQPVASTL